MRGSAPRSEAKMAIFDHKSQGVTRGPGDACVV